MILNLPQKNKSEIKTLLCYNIYMDAEKRARRQSLRVIISEIIMVIAVVATVSVLAFVVSGYWLGSDFKIERQGLLQIYSTPTGADVEVDNNPGSWLQRTNTSKTLSAGEHTIKLTKDGYDSWSRTISITEGLLYRLHYPRLFLLNRDHESALDFPEILPPSRPIATRFCLLITLLPGRFLISIATRAGPRALTYPKSCLSLV